MAGDIDPNAETRVLFVPPTRRDGEVTSSILAQAGIACLICSGMHELAAAIACGAGAILLADEALVAAGVNEVLEALAKQPSWSDLPIVLLLRGGTPSPAAEQVLHTFSNVTLLERPAATRSVVSAVQAAVRGRCRQYQIRDQIESTRRAEATSNELRRQLEIAVDASELGTFHCDVPLNNIVWNERCKRHFWLPPDARVDFELFYSLLHPEDRQRTREAVEACVYGGQVYDIEYRVVSPEGALRWIRATGRTIYDERQQPIQFDGTTQDITQRKRAEVALREASTRKDEFLATLAHELRNPLAPIRNALNVLRLSGESSMSLASMREIMERQVDHMVHLIDDLLDVSRISRGKVELRKQQVELAPIVATAVETIQALLDQARQELTVSLPAEPIFLEADPVRLAQIIGNLLNNATKYTDAGGRIWLTARRDGREVAISVRDNGLGIPSDMLPRVFEMFAQVDRSISRAQGGLGIGLTLAKSFVEMHHGRIEVHSGGLGQGSEFVVHLPILDRSQSSSPAPPTGSRAQLSRRRVLVVDDTSDARFVLGKLLELLGQQVRTANDAATALESVEREVPDLVISDIGMPSVDGYELARRLRRQPGLESVPLVALTGYGQETDKQRAKEAGFDYHLVKPVGVEVLKDLLKSLPAAKHRRS